MQVIGYVIMNHELVAWTKTICKNSFFFKNRQATRTQAMGRSPDQRPRAGYPNTSHEQVTRSETTCTNHKLVARTETIYKKIFLFQQWASHPITSHGQVTRSETTSRLPNHKPRADHLNIDHLQKILSFLATSKLPKHKLRVGHLMRDHEKVTRTQAIGKSPD